MLALLFSVALQVAASPTPAPVVTAAARPATAHADSVGIRHAARRAQAQFEETRRRNLPFESDHRGACELRRLRFCFWHDVRSRPTAEEVEPDAIVAARDTLLAALANAAQALPGDAWIAGQRVRYLLEARRTDHARRAVEECRAAAWWCASLSGLVEHVVGDDHAADAAYTRALRGMPAAARCRWTDVRALLPESLRGRARCAAPDEPDALAARLWFLAQPLYLREVNDRWLAHLARHTVVQIDSGASAPFGSWSPAVSEAIVRYGWPVWWTRHPPSAVPELGVDIDGHEARPSWHFLPSERLLGSDGVTPRADDWRLQPHGARSRYAPRYARLFASLAAQVAVFPRRDSTIVVARLELPDTLFRDDSLEVGLAIARDPGTPVRLVRRQGAGPGAVTLIASAPWTPRLASVEALAPTRRAAARMRVGLPAPDDATALALSDLLLFSPRNSLPISLAEAASTALPALRLRRGQRVGIFWETRGLRTQTAPLEVAIEVERVGAGWLARASERLRISDRASPVRLSWSEPTGAEEGVAGRAVHLELRALPPGRYRVRLSVRDASGRSATSERVMELTDR